MPSAVLSTHTGGFTGYTFHDLTAEMPRIIEHWEREQIRFDAVNSGYLGNASQTEYLKEIYGTLLQPGGLRIADADEQGGLVARRDRLLALSPREATA